MLNIAMAIAATLLGIALILNIYRLWRGPLQADRILALDTLYINALGLLLLLDLHLRQTLYLEVALLIAAFGFIGTVALAKFVARGSIVD